MLRAPRAQAKRKILRFFGSPELIGVVSASAKILWIYAKRRLWGPKVAVRPKVAVLVKIAVRPKVAVSAQRRRVIRQHIKVIRWN